MKRYTIEVVIVEGNDEFWDDIKTRGVSGCDDVLEMVKRPLNAIGIDFGTDGYPDESSIKISKFEDI